MVLYPPKRGIYDIIITRLPPSVGPPNKHLQAALVDLHTLGAKRIPPIARLQLASHQSRHEA